MDFVGINKLSLLDFPGRTSVILFSGGCNFRCPFCHNGLTLVDKHDSFIPFDDILSFLRKRKGVIDGVVISGGEPTLMPDLINKIIVIKELGYEIKLDTNGTNPETIKELLDKKLIDYIAMDIKNGPSSYALTSGLTSIDLEKIKTSIKLIINSGIEYEFRTTLISEYHNEESIKEIGELIKGSKALYLQAFKISDGVINKNLHLIDEDLANKYKDLLLNYINKVELRGY